MRLAVPRGTRREACESMRAMEQTNGVDNVSAREARHAGARSLGSYQLVERLGEGAMGEVWLARHRLLARCAAIKLIRPEALGGADRSRAAETLVRFEHEAQATATLTSPHTVRLFDFGLTLEGSLYYVMELLDGCDLESLVREFGPLQPERVLYLVRQVCRSLAEAHAKGVVHRDIKPANIYVCRMGVEYDFVKVLDFGLARTEQRGAPAASSPGIAVGTPAYMAPEVILGDSHVDRRADVYGVGCVAYYLLTGELVFDAETPMQQLMRHVTDEPPPPSSRAEQRIPRQLDDLVMACLQKDPERRPASAGALFKMAGACRTGDVWGQAEAERWWHAHLPHRVLTNEQSVPFGAH
jgi:eukaryotic-like serine/threonine-protein kinase